MKIGIITYHSAHNYGAMLQAYGLQQFLQSLDHDVDLIDYHSEALEYKNRRKQSVRSARDLARCGVNLLLSPYFSKRYASFEEFKASFMKLGRRYTTAEELLTDPPLYDAYICGSDQIWNVNGGISPVNFLQFAPPGRLKISYAPSLGEASIPQRAAAQFPALLEGFSALSVREQSAVKIIDAATGITPECVLDPVFLLERKLWEDVAKTPQSYKPYIAFYALETNPILDKTVQLFAKRLEMPVVVLGKASVYMFTAGLKIRIDSGPREFLGWIRRADLVITNSFHATAFSIIFQRPFISVPHQTRNTRIENLLVTLGLEDRSCRDYLDGSRDAKHALNPDFTRAERKLTEQVVKARDFLIRSLRK